MDRLQHELIINMTASSPHTILRRRDQFVSELEAGDQGTDGASSQVRVADNSMLMKFQREMIGSRLFPRINRSCVYDAM